MRGFISQILLNITLFVNPFSQQGNCLHRTKTDAAIAHGTFIDCHHLPVLDGNISHGANRHTLSTLNALPRINFQLIRICVCPVSEVSCEVLSVSSS